MPDPKGPDAPPRPAPWRFQRLLVVASILQLAAVLAVWGLLRFAADRWWPATLVLFGPRWVWGAPLVALIPLAIRRDKRLLAPLGLALALLLVPVMDLHVPAPGKGALARSHPPRDLRIVTYNVGGGKPEGEGILRLFQELAPDVMVIQECFGPAFGPAVVAAHLPNLTIRISPDICLISRFAVLEFEHNDRKKARAMGGSGAIERYTLDTPRGLVTIVTVHLATVRQGLREMVKRGLRGQGALDENIRMRELESSIAREWVDGAVGPVIVAGDFNLPEESAIYQRHWADFTNAFSTVGLGYGTSKVTGLYGIRIDHVLLGPGWECDRLYVATPLSGDHRPLVADLRWTGPP